MKAIYKKTAYDKLVELFMEAEYERRPIDYFLVTPDEWGEIIVDRRAGAYVSLPDYMCRADVSAPIRYVDLKPKSGHRYDYKRFLIRHEKFMGHDVVVAPIEYH
ncbi:hypothetical protein A7981_05635 [Methylovorus sp. MM2]|uniref:hypothetical protein n=1 Tax=Methylovorus sp. MM2 TaxID=1848038 RepID=UPI0007DF31BA|nr:hypothetical protein [Methylovorus sp. MM2]OAM52918.1 hypothetical protein A7981_05635 [Methylovorus sp. MM2]